MLRNFLVILSLLLFVSACSLSPRKARQVDERIAGDRLRELSCLPREVDRCAVASPLLELGRQDTRNGTHHVTLIESGEEALKIRIHMIRSAQRYVDVQSFILRRDDTGELVLNELLNAARRGVKVRLLLDQMFSLSDLEYLVRLAMAHINFEVRFYNPTFYKAKMSKSDWITGSACCFRRFNQRMHNKLVVVDDTVGITGGRNTADRYFDFDTSYEFKDRDIVVFGETARDMRESFDWFWDDEKSVPVQHLRDVAHKLLNGASTRLEPWSPPERLKPLLAEIEDPQHMDDLFIKPAYAIDHLEYFSDKPRKADFPEDAMKQDITWELLNVLESARESVVIQSPYMVLSKKARRVFKKIRDENPDIELIFSTNSLASTDADTAYANTHKHKKRYVKGLGFWIYELKPFPVDAPMFFPRWSELIAEKEQGITSRSAASGDNSTIAMPAPRIGLHAKSFVVDSRIAMVGSHNFDPRSEGFNTENGLIIRDETFARVLEHLILRDTEPQNSWVVALRPDDKNSNGYDSSTQPEFRLWPYRATSLFELVPEGEPMPPGSPEFYQNYHSVGSFPEVIRTRRQVTVMFLSSFFGFLEPIL